MAFEHGGYQPIERERDELADALAEAVPFDVAFAYTGKAL